MSNADIMLAPDEQGLYARDMRPNLALFWLRTRMQVTNRRVAFRYPNTILGLIPLGYEERSYPIGAVAGVNTAFKVNVVNLFSWMFTAFFSYFLLFNGSWTRIIPLTMAIIGILTAFQSSIRIQNNGGATIEADVSFVDKQALEDFASKANEIIYSASPAGQSWSEATHAGNLGINYHQQVQMQQPQPQHRQQPLQQPQQPQQPDPNQWH